jgi:hypothetical protein
VRAQPFGCVDSAVGLSSRRNVRGGSANAEERALAEVLLSIEQIDQLALIVWPEALDGESIGMGPVLARKFHAL